MPPGGIFAPTAHRTLTTTFSGPDRFHQTRRRQRHSASHLAAGSMAHSPLPFPRFSREGNHRSSRQSRRDHRSLRRASRSRTPAGQSYRGPPQFQDAELFIGSRGQKGPQVEILTPGTYRILTNSIHVVDDNVMKPGLFTVRLFDATVISENQIGLVEALDGAPLDPRDYVATPIDGHDNFQDCNEFIRAAASAGRKRTSCCPALTTSTRSSSKSFPKRRRRSSRARLPSSSPTSAKTPAKRCAADGRESARANGARRAGACRRPARVSTTSTTSATSTRFRLN